MHISMTQALTYKSSSYRTGILVLSPATYHVAWGTQNLDGPHMRLDEPDPEAAKVSPYYGCDLGLFLETYEDVVPGTYVKKTLTKILGPLTEEIWVTTKEGLMLAKAGYYVCEDHKGNQWPITPEVFRATYTLA
jgi:hypothetical protein